MRGDAGASANQQTGSIVAGTDSESVTRSSQLGALSGTENSPPPFKFLGLCTSQSTPSPDVKVFDSVRQMTPQERKKFLEVPESIKVRTTPSQERWLAEFSEKIMNAGLYLGRRVVNKDEKSVQTTNDEPPQQDPVTRWPGTRPLEEVADAIMDKLNSEQAKEREKKAAQQSTTDGKKDASDNKSSAGGEFGDKRRKEEGSGKKPPPKTMNAGGDVKGARPPSTAAPTRSPTLTHRQHMAHLHRQREIRENYEKRGKGSERFAFSPVPVREKETPPSIKNRADVVLRLEQDPSAPKRYRQLPNPSAWSYLTRILEESKLHKEASLLLSRQMMPNMIPDSLLNPHKHKRDKAQEEDLEKTREESGSQHPATQQGQGQSSCGQNPRPATEEPSKSSENQPKKEPEIRSTITIEESKEFFAQSPHHKQQKQKASKSRGRSHHRQRLAEAPSSSMSPQSSQCITSPTTDSMQNDPSPPVPAQTAASRCKTKQADDDEDLPGEKPSLLVPLRRDTVGRKDAAEAQRRKRPAELRGNYVKPGVLKGLPPRCPHGLSMHPPMTSLQKRFQAFKESQQAERTAIALTGKRPGYDSKSAARGAQPTHYTPTQQDYMPNTKDAAYVRNKVRAARQAQVLRKCEELGPSGTAPGHACVMPRSSRDHRLQGAGTVQPPHHHYTRTHHEGRRAKRRHSPDFIAAAAGAFKHGYFAEALEDSSANEPIIETQYQLIKRYPLQLEQQIENSVRQTTALMGGGDATRPNSPGNKPKPASQPLGIAGAIVHFVTEKIADFLSVPADQPAEGFFPQMRKKVAGFLANVWNSLSQTEPKQLSPFSPRYVPPESAQQQRRARGQQHPNRYAPSSHYAQMRQHAAKQLSAAAASGGFEVGMMGDYGVSRGRLGHPGPNGRFPGRSPSPYERHTVGFGGDGLHTEVEPQKPTYKYTPVRELCPGPPNDLFSQDYLKGGSPQVNKSNVIRSRGYAGGRRTYSAASRRF